MFLCIRFTGLRIFKYLTRSRFAPGIQETFEHVCPNNCGRKYKYKRNLKAHLKHECGVPKQFICTICDRAFALKGSLKSHMGIKHQMILSWYFIWLFLNCVHYCITYFNKEKSKFLLFMFAFNIIYFTFFKISTYLNFKIQILHFSWAF